MAMQAMCSATPDLFYVEDETLYLWDFKSGLKDQQQHEVYVNQVVLYAYAIEQLQVLKLPVKRKELVLCYIDQGIVDRYTMSNKEIEMRLNTLFESLVTFSN